MTHRVEIRASEGSSVATRMSEMRAWLDDRRFEPDLFVPSGVVFRIEFKVASEAMAFAEAFHGRVLD